MAFSILWRHVGTDFATRNSSEDKNDPDSPHLLNAWHPICISQKPVDFNTIPKFEERELPLGRSLQRASLDIGLLLLFNVVFFMGAYLSFLRYDVT